MREQAARDMSDRVDIACSEYISYYLFRSDRIFYCCDESFINDDYGPTEVKNDMLRS